MIFDKNRNLCDNCKKPLENLWKYDAQYVRCPYCGALLKVYSFTQYFTKANEPVAEMPRYMSNDNIHQLEEQEFTFYITNNDDVKIIQELLLQHTEEWQKNGIYWLMLACRKETQKAFKEFLQYHQLKHLDLMKQTQIFISYAGDTITFKLSTKELDNE